MQNNHHLTNNLSLKLFKYITINLSIMSNTSINPIPKVYETTIHLIVVKTATEAFEFYKKAFDAEVTLYQSEKVYASNLKD